MVGIAEPVTLLTISTPPTDWTPVDAAEDYSCQIASSAVIKSPFEIVL